MKNNNTNFKQNGKLSSSPILGFYSLSDFVNTFFCPASGKVITITSILGGISSMITGYLYYDAGAIFFLLGLLAVDGVTGVVNAIKSKTFSSTRMPRILLTMVSMFIVLSLATNMAKYSPELNFIPGVCYTSFSVITAVSILENLKALGIVSQGILDLFKSKSEANK